MVLGETRSVARHWICATPIRKMITATSPFWSRSRFGTLKVTSPSRDDIAAVFHRETTFASAAILRGKNVGGVRSPPRLTNGK